MPSSSANAKPSARSSLTAPAIAIGQQDPCGTSSTPVVPPRKHRRATGSSSTLTEAEHWGALIFEGTARGVTECRWCEQCMVAGARLSCTGRCFCSSASASPAARAGPIRPVSAAAAPSQLPEPRNSAVRRLPTRSCTLESGRSGKGCCSRSCCPDSAVGSLLLSAAMLSDRLPTPGAGSGRDQRHRRSRGKRRPRHLLLRHWSSSSRPQS